MKSIISILLFIICFFTTNAQDSTKVTPPKIITKLKVGNSFNLDSKTIKFIEVAEDSRCPSDVSCVWAGQAKIVVGFYENDILIEEKEVIFGTKAITSASNKELMKSEGKAILAHNLIPYPSSNQKINPSDYYLELVIR